MLFHGRKMSAVTGHAQQGYQLQNVADLATSVLPATSYTAVIVGRNVYFLTENQQVFRLNLDDLLSGWHRVQPTIYKHNFRPPAGVLNDKIYVCGGATIITLGLLTHSTSTCEVYTENAEWMKISDMKQARSGNCVVSHKGYVYSIGGQDNIYWPMNSVERYDPLADKWEMIEPMKQTRCDATSTVFRDKIYVLGGQGTSLFVALKSVEYFDPTIGGWTLLPFQMTVGRKFFLSAFEFNGKLHALGGARPEDWMEILDIDEGKARKVETGVGQLEINHRASFCLN